MAKKRIDRNKIIQAFLTCAFEKSAGAVSLADIASLLGVNKASLYNHFSSRDAICEAAIDFCAEYMSGVRFIPESADSLAPLSFSDALAKIVKQYFRSYEIEPLFQMYVFIHSSKFFSSQAARAAERETQKIADDTASFLAHFAAEGKRPLAENGCGLKNVSDADAEEKAEKREDNAVGSTAKSERQQSNASDTENANDTTHILQTATDDAQHRRQTMTDGAADEKINKSDAEHREQCSTFRTVCSHKAVAVDLNTFCYDAERRGIKPSVRLKERAQFFARELSAELNAYIVEKKETLRQSPESGAGSLFALPSDDSTLARIIDRAQAYWIG